MDLEVSSLKGERFTAGFTIDVKISRWLKIRLKIAKVLIEVAICITGADLSWEGEQQEA